MNAEEFKTRLVAAPGGCLLFRGNRNPDGYGMVRFGGAQMGAHRASWIIHRGPIPSGAFVLHSCDVPACCNPEHLRLGTHAENMKDRSDRGRVHRMFGASNPSAIDPSRLKRGEQHANHKLTEAQAREALSLKGTLSQSAIAAMYGVSRELIRGIHHGRFWKWLPRALPAQPDKRGTMALPWGER